MGEEGRQRKGGKGDGKWYPQLSGRKLRPCVLHRRHRSRPSSGTPSVSLRHDHPTDPVITGPLHARAGPANSQHSRDDRRTTNHATGLGSRDETIYDTIRDAII